MSALQDDARRVKVTTDEDEGPWPNDVIDDLIVSKPQLKRITVKGHWSIDSRHLHKWELYNLFSIK